MAGRLNLWLLPLSFAVGCGDNDGDNGRGDALINEGNWQAIVSNATGPLQSRIDAAIFGIEHDRCGSAGGASAGCTTGTYALDASHVDPAFVGREAVLIADVLEPTVEMLRYRNRILGFYRVLGDGTLDALTPTWRLPEVFGDVVTGFSSTPAVPAAALSALQPRLLQAYGQSVPTAGTHGLVVFGALVDLVPDNPIVLLDIDRLTFHQSLPGVVCEIGASESPVDVRPLLAQSERFAQGIRALFATHNVHFVNASWGYTIETVRGPWRQVCGVEPPPDDVLLAILGAYRPVFDALFNTEGVFAAHAALASAVDAHSPYDQDSPEFPNRLRVGVFQHPGVEVPERGRADAPASWLPEPGAGEADVWVNEACAPHAGCRARHPLSIASQYGMGQVAFPFAESSFVAPVLLGAFVYARHQRPGEGMSNDLIDDLVGTLIPPCGPNLSPCRYIDPLLHEQADGYHGLLPLDSALP
jgi:hypothetical protein